MSYADGPQRKEVITVGIDSIVEDATVYRSVAVSNVEPHQAQFSADGFYIAPDLLTCQYRLHEDGTVSVGSVKVSGYRILKDGSTGSRYHEDHVTITRMPQWVRDVVFTMTPLTRLVIGEEGMQRLQP